MDWRFLGINDRRHVGIAASFRGLMTIADWAWLGRHAGVNLTGHAGVVWGSCVSYCEL